MVVPNLPRAAGGALAAFALLTAACSSSSGQETPPRSGAVHVTVEDFKIAAPATVAAGTVDLRVSNRGPDTHELLLVRADGEPLPLRADDLTVDEEALEPRLVSLLDDDHPGRDRIWTVKLTPGRYVLICNMSGHYLGGMHTRLVVA